MLKVKQIIPLLVVIAFFTSFKNVNAAFATTIDNMPRMPVGNECIYKSRQKKDFSGAVYDFMLFIDPSYGIYRVSSNQLGLSPGSNGQNYYWNGSAWIVDTNTTGEVFDANTVNLLGPTYIDYLATCQVRAYNTASFTQGFYGLPNPYNIVTGQLYLSANWSLIPDSDGSDDLPGIIPNPDVFSITVKTVSPDTYASETWIRISYTESQSCMLYSATGTDHRILCGVHRLYRSSTNEILSIGAGPTTYYISNSSNVCGNIKTMTENLYDGGGNLACAKPMKTIDAIMPGYTPIEWIAPEADWGILNPLKDVFETMFGLLDTIMAFFYDTMKTVLGFFLPDTYLVQNFFNAQYRSWGEELKIDDVTFIASKISTDFSDGFIARGSYNPDITLSSYHGLTNVKVLDIANFKTYVYNNTMMMSLLVFVLIAATTTGIFSLIKSIITWNG